MNVLKVCLSYAHVETCLEKEDSKGNARNVFENADTVIKDGGSQEEKAILPEAWCDFERGHADEVTQEEIRKHLPQRIKKKCKDCCEDG